MADERNKFPDLVADADDDPTAEMETLGGRNPRRRKAGIDSLQVRLKERNQQLASLGKEAKNFHDTLESGKNVIEALQSKVEQQHTTIKRLRNDKLSANAENEGTLRKLADKDSHIARLLDELSGSTKETTQQADCMSSLRNQLREAMENNENLRVSIESDRTLMEQRRCLAEKEGCIAGNVQEINTLIQQINRTESYADELRTRLQDIAVSPSDELRHIHQLETSMAVAASQIRKLQEQLENEVQIVADLREQNAQIRCDFLQEIKCLRYELGEAEETIADQKNVGEQLASDLIDNHAYRQALEIQLDSTNRDNEKSIRDLTRKLKRLERTGADIERQMENKDSAIAALLSEVATRSHHIESSGEIEHVMHEIDGHMPERTDENPVNEKDRVSRLLIGNVDGRELQFPLFRRRLTIGRTAHNDIQLRTEFISRRHAIIVTENEQTRIIDWGSKNGVYVNHSRVAEQTLKHGDIVAIGSAEFRYEERPKR